MWDSYGREALANQRIAELRRTAAARSRSSAPRQARSRRVVRPAIGRGLVRLGERLANQAGTPTGVAVTR